MGTPKDCEQKTKQGEKDIDAKRETVMAWNRTQRPSPKHKSTEAKCSWQKASIRETVEEGYFVYKLDVHGKAH